MVWTYGPINFMEGMVMGSRVSEHGIVLDPILGDWNRYILFVCECYHGVVSRAKVIFFQTKYAECYSVRLLRGRVT